MRRRGAGLGRRGPGLLGTVARTAVVAGTASAVVGGVESHRSARAHQQQAQIDAQVAAALAGQHAPAGQSAPSVASPAAGGIGAEAIAKLQQLGGLHQQGILTDEEFATAKARVLGG